MSPSNEQAKAFLGMFTCLPCHSTLMGYSVNHWPGKAGFRAKLSFPSASFKWFRGHESFEGNGTTIPTIALTANAMEGDRELCIQAGCDDYLSKPIEREKLLELLDRYLPAKTTANGK